MAVKLIYVLHEDPARISEQASGPKGQAGYMPKVRVPMLGLLKHELSLGRTFARRSAACATFGVDLRGL